MEREQAKPHKHIPLIPKSELQYNHDSQSVLREVFQEILQQPTLPDNVARNIATYNVDSELDKEAALTTLTIKETKNLKYEELQCVERKLEHLICLHDDKEEELRKNPKNKEIQRLKRDFIFPNIDENDAKEFGLLTSADFLPSKLHQSLDFNYRKPYKCVDPCTCPDDLDKIPVKLPNIAKEKLPKIEDPRLLKEWKKICGVKTKSKHDKSKSSTSVTIDPANFRLNKDTILFANYKKNVIYKKRFKLQNISKSMQYVKLAERTADLHKYFHVQPDFDPVNCRLSAGMSATFIVFFKADSFFDIQETYQVNGHTIKLVSYRDAPNISVFLLRNIWPVKVQQPNYDVSRAQAMNNTIECGSCFVGEKFQAFLIIKNNGGCGKFFFMTEEQWYSQDIDSVHDDHRLDFGNFSLKPNYFELETNEFIIVEVEFYGSMSDLCVENVLLLCNNITWEIIDFIADVITFDKYVIDIDQSTMICKDHFIEMVMNMHPLKSYSDLRSETANISEKAARPTATSSQAHVKYSPSRSAKSTSSWDVDDSPPTMEKEIMADANSDADYIDHEILNYLLNQEEITDYVSKSALDFDEEYVNGPEYLLYCGHTLGYRQIQQQFCIHNKSIMNLKYRWNKHALNKDNYGEQFQALDPEWITIEGDDNNCLEAYGMANFTITMKPQTGASSFYGLALSFIIENVPKCAVKLDAQNKHFIIIEHSPPKQDFETEIVDVQVALIDAICFVDGVRFTLDPMNVFASTPYQVGTIVKQEFKLIVECDYDSELYGVWLHGDKQRCLVTPQEFTMQSGVPHIFDIEVEINDYENIFEEMTIMVENCYKQTWPLMVYVDRPHLKFSRTTLNFGVLYTGNVYERKFQILNANYVNVDWEIREQYAKDCDRPGLNKVCVFANNLECGDVEITYKVTTSASVKWSSLLILYTIYEGVKMQEAKIVVVYEICDNPVLVHTESSECPILSSPEVLYVNNKRSYTLCFHNTKSSPAILELGEPYGTDCELFDIQAMPKQCTIPARRAHRVNVAIVPTRRGIYDNIFIPFRLQNNSAFLTSEFCAPPPVTLTVLLVVEDISVKVHMPGHQEITWPPPANYDFGAISCTSEMSMSSLEHQHFTHNDTEFGLPADLIEYLRKIEDVKGEVPDVQTQTETASSFSSDTSVSLISCDKINTQHGFAKMSPFIIEVCDIKLREVAQFTIQLENVTPVFGFMQIDELNFPCKAYHKTGIDSVLEKLAYKQDDSWEQQVGEHGIAIKHDCALELKPFGRNEIVLQIYANTWGIYKEEMQINFNNILPLSFSLVLHIVGAPIEFPIGTNCVHKTAILRFGLLAYKSALEIRKLQVKNTSSIPANVIWHIFMRHTNAEIASEPITILFDVFHPEIDEEPSSQGNLMISHGKHIGKSENTIFKLLPKETLISPKETITLKIGLNPKAYATTFAEQQIEAYLIGYVQLPQKYKNNPLLFTRATGSDISPAKAKLTATLELPILKLEMSANDLHLFAYADKVIDASSLRLINHLTFKNLHDIDVNIALSIETPFAIIDCEASRVDFAKDRIRATAKPNEIVRVTISCETDREEVSRISKCMFSDSDEDVAYYTSLNMAENTYNVCKYLKIEQKGFVRQSIPCTFTLYFPILEVDTEVAFGHVFVGNCKRDIFTVKNYSPCTVEFIMSQSECFRVVPENGVIKPGRKETPMLFDMHFVFTPLSRMKYEETLEMQTQFAGLSFRVKVSGQGRHDERFYAADTY